MDGKSVREGWQRKSIRGSRTDGAQVDPVLRFCSTGFAAQDLKGPTLSPKREKGGAPRVPVPDERVRVGATICRGASYEAVQTVLDCFCKHRARLGCRWNFERPDSRVRRPYAEVASA